MCRYHEEKLPKYTSDHSQNINFQRYKIFSFYIFRLTAYNFTKRQKGSFKLLLYLNLLNYVFEPYRTCTFKKFHYLLKYAEMYINASDHFLRSENKRYVAKQSNTSNTEFEWVKTIKILILIRI